VLRLQPTQHGFNWADSSQAALIHTPPDASAQHHFLWTFPPSLISQHFAELMIVIRHQQRWESPLLQQL
tara:strand:- start:26 stop:232 length:207 start_codon:yes stop_codon:yes gene_type:complete